VPRPVLAVLLAYTKMLLYKRIVGAELAGDQALERYYRAYFPPSVVQRFRLEEAEHPLKRQIVATVVTNRVVDQAGMTFVPELAAFAGRSWVEVVEAYLLADEIVDGPAFREQVYALASTLPADTQYRLLMELEALLAEIVRTLLLEPRGAEPLFASEPRRREEFRAYCDALPGLLDDAHKEAMAGTLDELEREGMRPEAARLGAMAPYLHDYPLVCALAAQGGIPVPQAFALVACVDERFCFGRLQDALGAVHHADRMQKRFGDGLLRTLEQQRRSKLSAVLQARAPQPATAAGASGASGTEDAPEAWLEAYLAAHTGAWNACEAMLRQVLAAERSELVALAVVIGQLEGV
jgi:glutamate dehydrogenase